MITKTYDMIATNINIEDFVDTLEGLREEGAVAMNIEMLQDEDNPRANKLIIHPIYPKKDRKSGKSIQINIKDVSTDNNDIFDLFNDIV